MTRLLSIAALAILAGRAGILLAGERSFQAPRAFSLPETAVAAACGRFVRGGGPGIALVHGTSRITVLVPDPWTETAPIAAGNGCVAIRAADIDGDGADDLAVSDPGSVAYEVLGNGDGSFRPPVALERTDGARAAVAGDWDRDGVLDLAVVRHPEAAVAVLLGHGDGGFTAGTISIGLEHHNHDLDAFDIDGDGRSDLIVAVDRSGLVVLAGAEGGAFLPQPPATGLGDQIVFVAGCDIDADGRGDVLGLQGFGEVGSHHGQYTARIGIGDGRFSFAEKWSAELLDCMPGRADIDGDGVLDLLLSGSGTTGIAFGRGNGDGTFLALPDAPWAIPVAFFPAAILPADLDLDGKTDLVVPETELPILTVVSGEPGEPPFRVPRPLSVSPPVKPGAVADIDRDGFPDVLAAVSRPAAGIEVFFGAAGGPAWNAPPSLSLSTTRLWSSLAAADLDGDGIADLAGTSIADGTLLIALLDGEGRIRREVSAPVGPVPGPVAVGDIMDDVMNGLLDLAVPSPGADRIVLFYERGEAHVPDQGRLLPTIASPRKAIFVDLDGGYTDIAVLSSDEVAVHWGAEDSAFGAPVTVLWIQGSLSDIAAGDGNGDGIPDLVVADSLAPSIVELRGKAGRTFEASPPLPMPEPIACMEAADLDGDSFSDVAAGGSSGSLFLLSGSAEGLRAAARHALGVVPSALRIADPDGDGAPEIVVFADEAILIVDGDPAGLEFRRGDADGSGAIDLSDPIGILAALFQGSGFLVCEDAADGNDDGAVNISDPIFILSALFLGGGPIPPPADCAPDPTADPLGCAIFAACP